MMLAMVNTPHRHAMLQRDELRGQIVTAGDILRDILHRAGQGKACLVVGPPPMLVRA
jgi:ribonucleotide monophosphatase NagD (HAD superfamily)